MNDDLKILRDSWGTPAAPSPETRAAARAALLERATGATSPGPVRVRRGFRMPRLGVRLVAVTTLAAAIATGVTVLETSDGDRSMVPGVPPVSVAGAAETLDRAAFAAEHRPFTPPRPDQWTYTRYKNMQVKQRWPWPGEETNKTKPPEPRIIEEQWTRADGKRSAFLDGGKLHFVNQERYRQGNWPPSDYARLAALPTDPDELLAMIYHRFGTAKAPWERTGSRSECGPTPRTDIVFGMLLQILGTGLPPKVEATVYRAMKKVPGVVLNRSSNPDTGRPEVGLGLPGWQFNEVLFDARTYRYVGQRSTMVKDPREVMRKCGAIGIKQSLNMRIIDSGVVDKAGQRPR
jgi:hypothetical protein